MWLRKHRGASDPTIKLYARNDRLMTALGAEPARWGLADIRGYFMDRRQSWTISRGVECRYAATSIPAPCLSASTRAPATS